MTEKEKILKFQIVLPMAIGCFIYALWRNIEIIDPTSKIFPLLEIGQEDWIINSLGDGLWLYALNASHLLVWERAPTIYLILWILASLCLSITLEFAQKYEVIQGTFDKNDITFYLLSFVIFCAINSKRIFKTNHP
jgi:hypothetical protein